jgi:serine/threonine protein kinase
MRTGDLLAARYRIGGHLERSRRGELWLAHDEARDAPCEVEALRLSGLDGEDAVRLLAREVEVGRRLEGASGLLRALGYGVAGGAVDGADAPVDLTEVWIARESTEGTAPLVLTADDLLTRVARVARVARAVAALHDAGAVHRDLGPHAVLETMEGELRLTSLGLARLEGLAEAPLGPTGLALGAPACAAPELLARPDLATARADVHALGALLFRALCGAWPWGAALLDVVRAQERVRAGAGEAPRPRRVNAEVPPALDAVCGEALELDPAERAPTAHALAEVLEAWLEEVTTPRASPPSTISPPPPLPAAAPLPPAAPPPDPLFVPEEERLPPGAFDDVTELFSEEGEGIEALVVEIPAKALEQTVVALRRLDPAGAPYLLVDMARVDHLGGAQLEALTELLTLSERRGLPVAVFGLGKPLRQLLRIMDLEQHVPTLLDAVDARAALDELRTRQRA